MGKKFLIRLPILGLASLSTDDRRIARVIEAYLADYIVEREESPSKIPQGGTVYVFTSKVLSDKVVPLLSKQVQLGRCVRVDNELSMSFPNRFKTVRQVLRTEGENEISLHSFMSSVHFAFRLKLLVSDNYDLSQQLFYDYVLAPLVQAYSFFGFLPIHASSFQTQSSHDAVLLVGLDGVGKSSLSELMIKAQARLLADNIVLFNGQEVVPLLWPIRVDVDSDLVGSTTYVNKRFREVRLPIPPNVTGSMAIKRIYRLSVGGFACTEVKKNGPFFWRDLVIANLAAPEIEYMYKKLAPLFNFLAFRDGSNSRDISVPCYELILPMGELELGVKAILNEK